MIDSIRLFARLGPGLLFAGAAIGTSHLVQSTRAGALYGLGLMIVVVAAYLLKYPAYRFGPAYTAATGMSLIEGYRRLGRPAVVLISISQYLVQVIILAAVSLTTAGLAAATLGLTLPPPQIAFALLVLALILSMTGGFRWMEIVTKGFVALLTVATVAATALVVPDVDWSVSNLAFPELDAKLLFFIVALAGLMPAALDLSILHSLWAKAKNRTTSEPISHQEAMLDFDIGYFGSAALALCFVVMGAGLMHTQGTAPAPTPVGFAGQVIALYEAGLGRSAALLVAVAAFGVVFTTVITVMDGFPRVHAATWRALASEDGRVDGALDGSLLLRAIAASQVALAGGILLGLMSDFLTFIDVMTTAAFLVAPIIAVLNHLVMKSDDVPAQLRPSPVMTAWSGIGIATLTLTSMAYLYVRFGANA